jgi:hypothetical protein
MKLVNNRYKELLANLISFTDDLLGSDADDSPTFQEIVQEFDAIELENNLITLKWILNCIDGVYSISDRSKDYTVALISLDCGLSQIENWKSKLPTEFEYKDAADTYYVYHINNSVAGATVTNLMELLKLYKNIDVTH